MIIRVCDKFLKIVVLIVWVLFLKYFFLIYKCMGLMDLFIMGCEWKFVGKMFF